MNQADLDRYDRVWKRVAPALEPYPETAAALPGAEANPCCMGSEAQEDLEVLAGFLEEELANRRKFLALAGQAPAWAWQTLRDLSDECAARARRLAAVYYLITGRQYAPAAPAAGADRFPAVDLRPALRQAWHTLACGGMNYLRAAEGTADTCLARVFSELGENAYAGAYAALGLLEQVSL